jgi:hypothetical protein
MNDIVLDKAICELASVVLAANLKDGLAVRLHLRRAAECIGTVLDVSGDNSGGFRLVQEYALTAAKALCTVRAPPALRPDHAQDALKRAHAALEAAYEVACGRRAA